MRIHFVEDHLFPLITGQPPKINQRKNQLINLSNMLRNALAADVKDDGGSQKAFQNANWSACFYFYN